MAESAAGALAVWSHNRREDLAEMRNALNVARTMTTPQQRILWLDCARTYGRCVKVDDFMIKSFLEELSLCSTHVSIHDCNCVPTF